MFVVRQCEYRGDPVAAGCVRQAALDVTVIGSQASDTNCKVRLSGKITMPEGSRSVAIVISNALVRYEIGVDGMTIDGAPDSSGDFDIELSPWRLFPDFAIDILVDGRDMAWAQVGLELMEDVADPVHWLFALSRDGRPAENMAGMFELSVVDRLVEAIKGDHIVIEARALAAELWVQPRAARLMTAVAEHFCQDRALTEAVNCLESQKPLIFSFEGQEYICGKSVIFGEVNALIYRSLDDMFVILQYPYSFVGMFYPKINVSVSWFAWTGAFLAWKHEYLRLMLRDASRMCRYLADPSHHFIGYILGNGRPYHYYYDQICLLAAITDRKSDKDAPVSILNLEYCSFCSPRDIFGDRVRQSDFSSPAMLNESYFNGSSFAFLLGWANGRVIGKERTAHTFERIRAALDAKGRAKPRIALRAEQLARHFPVIWMGVTSQKRLWIEQTAGIVEIVRALSTAYPGMAVVLDGWTPALQPSRMDEQEIARDEDVANQVIALLPGNIAVHSVIGASSTEKIAIGSRCDFYVTNWLQGSLHIDNICKRPGVGHFNSKWQQVEAVYYHHDCTRIADELIGDQGNEGPSTTDYSIAPGAVFEVVRQVLSRLDMTQVRKLPNDI